MPIEVTPYPFGRKGMLPYTPPIPVGSQVGSVVTGGAPPSVLDAASTALIPPAPGAIANPHHAIPALPDAGYTAPPGLIPSGSVYRGPNGSSMPSLAMLREREMAGESIYAGGSIYGGASVYQPHRDAGSAYGGTMRNSVQSVGAGPAMAGWAESVSHHLAPSASGYAGPGSVQAHGHRQQVWMPNSLPAPRQAVVPLAVSDQADVRRRHGDDNDRPHTHHHQHQTQLQSHRQRPSHSRSHSHDLGSARREYAYSRQYEHDRENDQSDRMSDASFYARPKAQHHHHGQHERSPNRSPSERSPSSVGGESPRDARRKSVGGGRKSLSPAPSHGHSSPAGQNGNDYSPCAPSPLGLHPEAPKRPSPHRWSSAERDNYHSHKRQASAPAGERRLSVHGRAPTEELDRSFHHLAVDDTRSYYAPSAAGTAITDGARRPRAQSHGRVPLDESHGLLQPPQSRGHHIASSISVGGAGRMRSRSLADYEQPLLPPGYAQSLRGQREAAMAVAPPASVLDSGYDDGGSMAGSHLTFLDGPVGGMTSHYGLPKYGHHPKPDHRRFMMQRGKADVFMD